MGGCGWVRPATVSWGPRERTRLANLPSIFATLPSIFAWSKIEGSGRSSKAVVSLVGSCGGGRDAVPATPAAAASPPVRLHPNPSSPTAALTVDRPVGDPLARQAAAVGPLPPGGINAPSPSAPPASGTAAAAAAAASAAAATWTSAAARPPWLPPATNAISAPVPCCATAPAAATALCAAAPSQSRPRGQASGAVGERTHATARRLPPAAAAAAHSSTAWCPESVRSGRPVARRRRAAPEAATALDAGAPAPWPPRGVSGRVPSLVRASCRWSSSAQHMPMPDRCGEGWTFHAQRPLDAVPG